MAANVNKWSETPASNATADPAINWAEGQAPSTVNDSARQMMAAIAADRDDTRGALTFGGTSAALTLTTNSGNATYQNGMRVSGKLASAFTVNATLNVDSIGAKNIYRYNNAGAGQVQAADGFTGQHVTFEYEAALNSSAGGWVLLGEAVGRIVGVQVLTASGTYTRNPAASTGDIYVIGGGGAGGGAQATSAGNASIGAGGGGGGIGISLNIALPATQAFTIGAGGTGVSAANGNNGGVTTFGAISANGGTGGQLIGNTPQAGPNVAGGGQGGTAGAGAALNFTGQDGSAALLATTVISGSGGNSPWQGGGAPRNLSTAVGTNATSYGSGGSGALNGPSVTAKAGGNGAGGAIIIVERA